MKIAMWSGPRNLSTAMMYSFAARGDCAVWDEPFYAAYLQRTGLSHPMRAEILRAGPTDPAEVVACINAPPPGGADHHYLKLMTHHMIAGFDRAWMERCRNVFLIRHPARVIASYAVKREGPTLEDIGFLQQLDLFEECRARGLPVVVVDSADIRADPRGVLTRLCAALGLPFLQEMLSWPAGGHPSDGVWAPHWYGAVHGSTGFAGPEGPLPTLYGDYAALCDRALPIYRALAEHRLA